jgi:hypothetical protein
MTIEKGRKSERVKVGRKSKTQEKENFEFRFPKPPFM